jgi:hypothetical protein
MKLAKSHHFHSYCREKLSQEPLAIQIVMKENPRGMTARLFKQSCMSEFLKTRKNV